MKETEDDYEVSHHLYENDRGIDVAYPSIIACHLVLNGCDTLLSRNSKAKSKAKKTGQEMQQMNRFEAEVQVKILFGKEP